MNKFEIFLIVLSIAAVLVLGIGAWIESGKAKDTIDDITLYINRQIRKLKWRVGI